jgi:mannose-6-phosphate isomerase-like protein (cupin superfamily)
MEPGPSALERLARELPERLVIKREDWYPQTEMGKSVAFDFPYRIGTNRIASSTPPNSPSKYVHRHFNEALIYILQGEGYSLVHDRRVDWKAGSVLRVPTFCWHHHHNAAAKPAIFLKNITSGLNNHLKWILLDNLPSREIGQTPL